MEILIALVMGVTLLFGGMALIGGVGTFFDAYDADDRRESAVMALVGVVLLTISFSSAAHLGKKERVRRQEDAVYNRVSCNVTVEGTTYHPDHVQVSRGTGYMTMADGSVIKFLGGTIQGCR